MSAYNYLAENKFFRRIPDVIAIGMVAFFSGAYLKLAFRNYHYFETGIDLGAYTLALNNLSHFRLPFDTFKNMVMWGDHAHFIISLIAPIFRLIPDARVILAIQALSVTLTGWALYKIAKSLINNPLFSLSLLYAYLAFIGTQYALNTDFHPSVLTGAAIIWFFYGIHFEKRWITILALALGLMTREDAPPIYFMIGAYLMFRKRWKLAFATMVISAVYFCVVAYGIMPIWTKDNAVLTYLDAGDKDPYNVIRGFFVYPKAIFENMFDNETKRSTIKSIYGSFGYLSLLSPLTYLGSLPILFSRFTSPHEYRWALNNYSNANILPIIAIGAIYGAENIIKVIRRIKPRYLPFFVSSLLGIALIYATHAVAWSDPKIPLNFSNEKHIMPDNLIAEHEDAVKKANEIIPQEAPIAVSSGFTARFAATRRQVQIYPEIDKVDWLVLSAYANPWPFSRDEMKHEIKILQKDKNFEEIWYKKGTYIFKRIGR